MNVFSKNKILKYLASIMVITQGILLAWMASFHMNAQCIDSLLAYPNSAIAININGIPEKNISSVLSYIKDYSQENEVFYKKRFYYQ